MSGPAAGRSAPAARAVSWIALAVVLAALGAAADGLVRLNTWYLASDQFAFLTFARDLRRGTVFHDDPAIEKIARKSPFRMDALAQTYFWRDGRLYSRYPPGFPALLAAAGAIGGETAEHALNPVLFLVVLAMIASTPLVLLPGERILAAASGAASAWLLLLLPTDIHLWGITVARDLPAHLLGLLAVLAAARGRLVVSGLVLGLAAVIRPDAVLYGVSIAVLAALARPPLSRAIAASAAFLVGAAPLFAYNWITEGHPLSFTQGGEFREVLGSAGPRAIAVAQTLAFGSGGAFRLTNLAESLPGNLAHLGRGFGWMAVPAAAAAVWSLLRRPRFAAALLPYSVVAVVFYSFWSHPDPRYLAGVALCLMPFAGLGLAVAAGRIPAFGRSHPLALILVVLVGTSAAAAAWRLGAAGALPWRLPDPSPAAWASWGALAALAALAAARVGVPASVVPAAVAGVLGRLTRALRVDGERGWAAAAVVPAVVLAVMGLVLLARGGERRDPVQRAQVERARAVLQSDVPPGSLVITDTGLGRPAENITHYADIRAIYGSELDLMGVAPSAAVIQHLLAGRRVFYLIDARDRYSLAQLRDEALRERLVGRRGGAELLDWFVSPREAPNGAVLYEVELEEAWKRRLDDLVAAGLVPPYPAYRGPAPPALPKRDAAGTAAGSAAP